VQASVIFVAAAESPATKESVIDPQRGPTFPTHGENSPGNHNTRTCEHEANVASCRSILRNASVCHEIPFGPKVPRAAITVWKGSQLDAW
jgi:hypothetical protein